ncbi:MAG TPA: TetR/AcrR family transcriptional regulator [Ohtaekwangia sp.]|nr:TetR/AcrR family transcriptional regulator [Ohtaekwangia sp.]
MRDPEGTIHTILRKSGVLFNTQGYKATSLSDITKATGLTKGAIYRHFKSKEDLEKKALYHLSSILHEKMREAIKAQPTAGKKMRAIFSFFHSYITNPPIKGGCPLLNVAVEADDSNPALRQGALKILNSLRESLITILANGIKHGQIKKEIDKTYYATVIFASLEGAIMMSKLSGNNDDIRRVIKHLDKLMTEIEI